MGGGGGNNNPSCRSKTKRPSFFKVLVGDFTKQLRIPRAFLNHFNGKLPEESILKSPTGRYCLVKMKKVQKDLVFRDGWERFVKEHSLEFGDFLVFRFSGNCKFKVKIYARNACEKEIVSVLSKKTNAESNSHKKKQKVDVATEKCTKVPRSNKNGRVVKEKKNNVEPISHKKKQKVDVATEKCTKFPRFNGKGHDVKEKKKATSSKKTTTCASVKPKRRLHIVEIEKNDAVDSYSCFIAACRPCTRNHLTVPKKVARENGLEKKKRVQLRDPNGRLWQVKIVHKDDGRFVLDQGWNAFWKEHNLGGGEICRFKFMQGLDNEIYVEIFRGGLTEYHSKKGALVESVRDAMLGTESNVIVNRNKEPVEESESRFILVKEESDSSMWL